MKGVEGRPGAAGQGQQHRAPGHSRVHVRPGTVLLFWVRGPVPPLRGIPGYTGRPGNQDRRGYHCFRSGGHFGRVQGYLPDWNQGRDGAGTKLPGAALHQKEAPQGKRHELTPGGEVCLLPLLEPDRWTVGGATVLGTTAASEIVPGRAWTTLGEEVVSTEGTGLNPETQDQQRK